MESSDFHKNLDVFPIVVVHSIVPEIGKQRWHHHLVRDKDMCVTVVFYSKENPLPHTEDTLVYAGYACAKNFVSRKQKEMQRIH